MSSLTDLQYSIDRTNNRLATGKRVNTALDSALNFFTARGLSDRATTLSTIMDNIGLGLKIHQNADKALTTMKSMLDNADGQVRQAIQASSQGNRAVTNFTFTGAGDTFLDTAGTAINRLGTGDTLAIQMTTTNASTGVITNVGAAVAITLTGTVQNVIDAVNTNATLNPTGAAPRYRAYLSDSNQFVIEGVGGEDPAAVIGFQLNVNASTGVQSLISDVIAYSGQSAGTVAYTGTAGTAQTAVVRTDISQTRKAAAASFREILQQITNIARDAGYNGTNLLEGDSLRVSFNEDDTTYITTRGVRYEAYGLGFTTDNFTANVGDSRYAFQSDGELKAAQNKIKSAKALVEAQQRAFSSNYTILQNRQDFATQVVKGLNEGSDLLTIADMNEEGASLAALQTRQQLSVTALSLANQSNQAILRLF